jgi:hypothetical protein
MILNMRTTLTLDDDLAGLLKQRAQELGVPFKEAVNRTIRAGLGDAASAGRRPAPKIAPHSFGFRPGVDLNKLGQLADELEAEAFADKAHDSARRKRPRSRAQL